MIVSKSAIVTRKATEHKLKKINNTKKILKSSASNSVIR